MADSKRTEAIHTLRQAILEFVHCIESGPIWFTHGRRGQLNHMMAWEDKANKAIDIIEKTNA